MYCTYAVAFIYGADRVAAGKYTGGDVMNVLVAALLGGFSLGQAAPSLQYFAKGKVAGAKLFAVIDRQPAIDPDSEEGQEIPQEQFKGEIVLQDVGGSAVGGCLAVPANAWPQVHDAV
jgi:ATP-binding cassette subfamily B (MDR/TAP) protein 1